MEKFWDQYRKGGSLFRQRARMEDYNEALKISLQNAGLSPTQIEKVMIETIRQQEYYGLLNGSFVPRIPGRINLPKP